MNAKVLAGAGVIRDIVLQIVTTFGNCLHAILPRHATLEAQCALSALAWALLTGFTLHVLANAL